MSHPAPLVKPTRYRHSWVDPYPTYLKPPPFWMLNHYVQLCRACWKLVTVRVGEKPDEDGCVGGD